MSNFLHLPGIIDIHVHLRDPGQTDKEDFYTGTLAALAGGVTTVFDMPNNQEPILTYEKLVEKIEIAKKKSLCDYGLYFGTDGKNLDQFEKVIDKIVGLKIYLNDTTGNLFIHDEKILEKIFRLWPKNKVIVVHAEGEKINLVIDLCGKTGNKVHITHVATKKDLEKILEAKKDKLNLTCDVTPHHLFLTKDHLKLLNGFGIVRPSLATKDDQEFLWKNIDKIDCIASDHAPHTIFEKKGLNPPSGVPGLETILPLLLNSVWEKKMTIDNLVRLININPQKIFDYQQNAKTYIQIDTDEEYLIENKNLKTKCGWSPFNGWKVRGKVKNVYLHGKKVFSEGKVFVQQGFGRNIFPD